MEDLKIQHQNLLYAKTLLKSFVRSMLFSFSSNKVAFGINAFLFNILSERALIISELSFSNLEITLQRNTVNAVLSISTANKFLQTIF
jgi:hypothetical protein